MKLPSAKQLRTKAFDLVVILLLAVVVSLTVLFIHKPQTPLTRITNTTLPHLSHSPPVPPTTGKFTTLPLGATLPSETDCASRVRRSSWEPRPDNFAANHRVPTPAQIAAIAPWTTSFQGIQLNARADTIRKQITGTFTGTTYEILQWVACKWGIDEDIVRAQAVVESSWDQSQLGDLATEKSLCPPGSGYPGSWNGSSCYQSYGILQMKYSNFRSTWPMSRDDTAFNAEYAYGEFRVCYEGWATYLSDRDHDKPLPGYPHYHAGDVWGCIGRWYSGNWYDQDAINYIDLVKTALANNMWRQPGF